jgi:uncharacterized membrane protein
MSNHRVTKPFDCPFLHVLPILLVGLVLLPASARADFKVCNDTSEVVSVAIAYQNTGGAWISRGWWNVQGDRCVTVLAENLENRYYYLFGETSGGTTWKGPHNFCVQKEPFTIPGSKNCVHRGFRAGTFFKVDTGDSLQWTQTLQAEFSRDRAIRINWSDATDELQAFASELTLEEMLALGLTVAFTGHDIYAARAKITNVGESPVAFDPGRLQILYGERSIEIIPVDHRRMLQPGRIDPGYYVEGLVVYFAPIDLGAAVRRGGGSMSYADSDVRLVNH